MEGNDTNPEDDTSTVGVMFFVVFSVTMFAMTSRFSMMSFLFLIISEFLIGILDVVFFFSVEFSILVDAELLGEASLEWNTTKDNHVIIIH